jgi:hypothetical protein
MGFASDVAQAAIDATAPNSPMHIFPSMRLP